MSAVDLISAFSWFAVGAFVGFILAALISTLFIVPIVYHVGLHMGERRQRRTG